jgi:hypothetical protein
MAQPDVIAFLRDLLISEGVGVEVRGGRGEPDDVPPFIVLEEAGALRDKSLPAYLPFRVGMTCFGLTEREASELYRTTTDILHRLGPLIENGVGMLRAYDETGPQPRDQAETRWPARYGVIGLYMVDTLLS